MNLIDLGDLVIFLNAFAGVPGCAEGLCGVGGTTADVCIRYQDANNGYKVEFYDSEIWLKKVVKGQWTTIRAYVGGGASAQTVQVRGSYSWPNYRITVYVGGTQQFYEEDSTFTTGAVALGGTSALFDNLKIGTGSDNDLDDAGDTIFVDESFGSTGTPVTYDKAGNLIDDGSLQYVYDAWNRLVKVRSSRQDNATIQTAEFDGLGRRIEKAVTNTGTFGATWWYFYDGQKIIETRDGSGNMFQQFIHGTRYIDELIQMRVKDKGDLYVHQDASWNVIALTDLGGSVVERYVYTPYGQVTVHQDTGYGDRDGDGDVDSTDKGTVGSTCTGTVSGACRILDLDFDGDYDSSDATKFDALTQGTMRTPGRSYSGANQPFAHQGLLLEPEINSYQNRARQYGPTMQRFTSRDPLQLGLSIPISHGANSPISISYLPPFVSSCGDMCQVIATSCAMVCGSEFPGGLCQDFSAQCMGNCTIALPSDPGIWHFQELPVLRSALSYRGNIQALESPTETINPYGYLGGNALNTLDPLGLYRCNGCSIDGDGCGAPNFPVPDMPFGGDFRICCNEHDGCSHCCCGVRNCQRKFSVCMRGTCENLLCHVTVIVYTSYTSFTGIIHAATSCHMAL